MLVIAMTIGVTTGMDVLIDVETEMATQISGGEVDRPPLKMKGRLQRMNHRSRRKRRSWIPS